MTRQELANGTITKLNGMDEAMELINILNYDECIYVLKNIKRVPSNMIEALVNRAKSFKGLTFELITANMRAVANS